jgi:hypothetical protein
LLDLFGRAYGPFRKLRFDNLINVFCFIWL